MPNRTSGSSILSAAVILYRRPNVGLLIAIDERAVPCIISLYQQILRLDGGRRSIAGVVHLGYHTGDRQSAVRLDNQFAVYRIAKRIFSLVDFHTTGMRIIVIYVTLRDDTRRVIRCRHDVIAGEPVSGVTP